MTRYIVKWEMIYEDVANEFEALACAHGDLSEIVHDPSVGANYFSVTNPDTPNTHTMIELDEALLTWESMKDE